MTIFPITFGSQAAQAQSNPQRDVVQGFGLSGQVVCPDGESFSASMDFFAVEDIDGDVIGDFGIITSDGEKDGVITDVHVTPSRFSAQGTETTDTICEDFGGGDPTTVGIRGQCDDNATVEFRAANGQRGTFIGQVLCARISN